MQSLLDELLEELTPLRQGEVASYIPELAKADPDWFGISAVTLAGHEYGSGDVDKPFTIQSIAKPFVYGLALECAGQEKVLASVGLEPTGDAFNAISLDPADGTPANPMINAGAIATTGIVLEHGGADASKVLLETLSRYVGRPVQIDESVYQSERETGHRNRAISHLLRGSGIVSGSPEAALDLYFRQCSVSVTCRELALMGACLANSGINPRTGERALESQFAESVLSVMGSCGMYDYAGEWIFRVGMPAKSGVAGGVLAVLPGQLGIGVFSPRLDGRGNSMRGVKVCEKLSRAFSLHMFHLPNLAHSIIRSTYDGSTVSSKRQRPMAQRIALAEVADGIRVYELQGELAFASAEALSQDAAARADEFDVVVFDFRRVDRVEAGAHTIMTRLISSLLDAGKLISLSDIDHLPDVAATYAGGGRVAVLADRDRALEWCEDRILDVMMPAVISCSTVPLAENELCRGLGDASLGQLHSVLKYGRASAGERIVAAGERGGSILLLTSGDVSVTVNDDGRREVRVATLSAGMAFGEMSALGESVRTANVIADSDVEYYALGVDDLERLEDTAPSIRAVVMENIARNLASRLRQANAELQTLSG